MKPIDWTTPAEIVSEACRWTMNMLENPCRHPALWNLDFRWYAPEDQSTPAQLFDTIAILRLEIIRLERRVSELEAKK